MGILSVMASVVNRFRDGGHMYSVLPNAPQSEIESSKESRRPAKRRLLLTISVGGVALCMLVSLIALARQDSCDKGPSRLWGQYTPYFAVPSDIEVEVPANCELTFVQVLSRHGARAPTEDRAAEMEATITKIQESTTKYARGYRFIKSYEYRLGADNLTAFGEEQMVDSGRQAFERYGSLAASSAPFIRASGQDRVVQSGLNWTQGFLGAAAAASQPMLVIPEGNAVNNPLNNKLCAAFQTGEFSETGRASQQAWLDKAITPIRDRLNKKLSGADLSHHQVLHIMDLCPFETVANRHGRVSKFCRLFGRKAWRQYDYYHTLGKFYGYGQGNPLGSTQGVGWVNELVARLTRQPVVDRTSTNATLDSDDATFPLNRTVYVDFSHDNDMSSMYAALGLYDDTDGHLPLKHRVEPGRAAGYAASWTVPFAARMYVEKMVCGPPRRRAAEPRPGPEYGELMETVAAGAVEELVRVIVNDRVVPLSRCGADRLGRCQLSKFVESLDFARGGGKWDEC